MLTFTLFLIALTSIGMAADGAAGKKPNIIFFEA